MVRPMALPMIGVSSREELIEKLRLDVLSGMVADSAWLLFVHRYACCEIAAYLFLNSVSSDH